jgi:hypothetical protein
VSALLAALLARVVAPDAAADCQALLVEALGAAPLTAAAAAGVYSVGALLPHLCALAVERDPAAVSDLLRHDARLWARVWEAPGALTAWFDGGWNAGGEGHHARGSLALARFALARRHSCWHLLAWTGARPVSPIVAAGRPAALRECAGGASARALGVALGATWWDSEELWASLRDGGAVPLAPGLFSNALLGAPAHARAPLLAAVLAAAPRALLAQRLLPALSEPQLLRALPHFGWSECGSIARARVAAALQRPGVGARRLAALCDEQAGAAAALSSALAAASQQGADGDAARHAALLAAAAAAPAEARLLVAAHAWLLRLRLDGLAAEALEQLMRVEGVAYRRSEPPEGRHKRRRSAQDCSTAWRVSLDDYALEMGAGALRQALAEAALEAWLQQAGLTRSGHGV